MFYIGLYRENMKKSSCLKRQGLESEYLVCRITKWTLTIFVKIMPLGSKWPGPRVTWFTYVAYIQCKGGNVQDLGSNAAWEYV